MSEMAYSPAGKNRRDREYVPKLLKACTHVFIRDIARSHSLQPSYRGPYKIVTKNDKYHTILINQLKPRQFKSKQISLNRQQTWNHLLVDDFL